MNNGGAAHCPIPSAEPRLSAQAKRVASKPWPQSLGVAASLILCARETIRNRSSHAGPGGSAQSHRSKKRSSHRAAGAAKSCTVRTHRRKRKRRSAWFLAVHVRIAGRSEEISVPPWGFFDFRKSRPPHRKAQIRRRRQRIPLLPQQCRSIDENRKPARHRFSSKRAGPYAGLQVPRRARRAFGGDSASVGSR